MHEVNRKWISSLRGSKRNRDGVLFRAPQVVLGTFGRLKLEFFGIGGVVPETLNPPYLQGKVPVVLRAGDGNRTRVLSLGS